MIQPPIPGEYNPYFQGYIDLVPSGNFMDVLVANTAYTVHYFENYPAEKHDYRYAPDKWNIRQMLMHIIDVERVMSYRALVAARGDDKTLLYSMDDFLYQTNSNCESRTLSDLIHEFKAVRAATEALFATITHDQSTFRANAINYPITARALGYIIAGHSLHHINVLETRYK
jgi:hypothetical protein